MDAKIADASLQFKEELLMTKIEQNDRLYAVLCKKFEIIDRN